MMGVEQENYRTTEGQEDQLAGASSVEQEILAQPKTGWQVLHDGSGVEKAMPVGEDSVCHSPQLRPLNQMDSSRAR